MIRSDHSAVDDVRGYSKEAVHKVNYIIDLSVATTACKQDLEGSVTNSDHYIELQTDLCASAILSSIIMNVSDETTATNTHTHTGKDRKIHDLSLF